MRDQLELMWSPTDAEKNCEHNRGLLPVWPAIRPRLGRGRRGRWPATVRRCELLAGPLIHWPTAANRSFPAAVNAHSAIAIKQASG